MHKFYGTEIIAGDIESTFRSHNILSFKMFFNPINMYGKPVYLAWGEVMKINRKNVRKGDKKKRNK